MHHLNPLNVRTRGCALARANDLTTRSGCHLCTTTPTLTLTLTHTHTHTHTPS